METAGISSLIKAKRMEAGMSLEQLARKAGTSVPSLSRYENGWNRFELYTLKKIAAALECRLVISFGKIKENEKKYDWRKLRRLFWDHPLKEEDLTGYSTWVIERVLDYGNLADVKFLFSRFGKNRFLDEVSKANLGFPRTRNYWKKYLELENRQKQEVRSNA